MNRGLYRRILSHVAQQPGCTVMDISCALQVDLKSMHRHLHRLAANGQLVRQRPGTKWHFTITDAGRAAMIPAAAEKQVNVVCDECRQHWQGYQIHKIFGSGAKRS